ncbi:MAG: uracil-DNA glycosylase, partial [Acidobacteriota bacterium]
SRTRSHAVPGEGDPNARILLLGEAPGKKEDLSGKPFVGRAGSYLNRALWEHGLSRGQLYITSILKCFDPKPPRKQDIETCLPWTICQLGRISPELVLIMGRQAERGLFGKSSLGAAVEVRHWDGRVCVITCHPAAAMRFPNRHRQFRRGMDLLTWIARERKILPL